MTTTKELIALAAKCEVAASAIYIAVEEELADQLADLLRQSATALRAAASQKDQATTVDFT